jgi:glucose-6-phosphate isomerase
MGDFVIDKWYELYYSEIIQSFLHKIKHNLSIHFREVRMTNPLHVTRFDPDAGTVAGAPAVERYLRDLRGAFADGVAYEAALVQGDPLLYHVTNIEPDQGDGALHYAIACLMPGRVGPEYYLTKGHVHAWRSAAEYYIGLQGEGLMILQDERTGDCWTAPLTPNLAVYVPSYTAHRTVNSGHEPLTYLGILPANAGHDYESVAQRNFRLVAVEVDGKPTVMERAKFLARSRNGV